MTDTKLRPKLEKVRVLIAQARHCATVLDKTGSPINAEALNLCADAALAELDAAEGKGGGRS